MSSDLKQPAYRPDHLIDVLIEKLGLSCDAKLAHHLDMSPATISKIRNKRVEIGPSIFLRLSEEVRMSVGALRELAGLPRRMYIGA